MLTYTIQLKRSQLRLEDIRYSLPHSKRTFWMVWRSFLKSLQITWCSTWLLNTTSLFILFCFSLFFFICYFVQVLDVIIHWQWRGVGWQEGDGGLGLFWVTCITTCSPYITPLTDPGIQVEMFIFSLWLWYNDIALCIVCHNLRKKIFDKNIWMQKK